MKTFSKSMVALALVVAVGSADAKLTELPGKAWTEGKRVSNSVVSDLWTKDGFTSTTKMDTIFKGWGDNYGRRIATGVYAGAVAGDVALFVMAKKELAEKGLTFVDGLKVYCNEMKNAVVAKDFAKIKEVGKEYIWTSAFIATTGVLGGTTLGYAGYKINDQYLWGHRAVRHSNDKGIKKLVNEEADLKAKIEALNVKEAGTPKVDAKDAVEGTDAVDAVDAVEGKDAVDAVELTENDKANLKKYEERLNCGIAKDMLPFVIKEAKFAAQDKKYEKAGDKSASKVKAEEIDPIKADLKTAKELLKKEVKDLTTKETKELEAIVAKHKAKMKELLS